MKDLRLLARDRRALGVLVLMPLVFIVILGASTGRLVGMKTEAAAMRVAVVDEGLGHPAAEVVETLKRCDGLRVSEKDTAAAAFRQVDDGEASAAIVFGPAWPERINGLSLRDVLTSAGAGPDLDSLDVSLYARPSNEAAESVARAVLTSCLYPVLLRQAARLDPVAAAYLSHSADGAGTAAGAETVRAPKTKAFAEGRAGPSVRPRKGVYEIIVPGYTVMFAFFLINIMARSFIAEREAGTLPRLRLAPLATWQVLAGKTVPFLIVSVVQGLLLFGFGKLLFGMSWGVRPWMLAPVIACTSLAATGLGLLTALSARTDAQVSAYGNLLVIVLAGISGCFMPREWLPALLRKISLATPHAWSLVAYDQLLVSDHPDPGRVALHCAVLAAFAATFALAACRRWRTLVSD